LSGRLDHGLARGRFRRRLRVRQPECKGRVRLRGKLHRLGERWYAGALERGVLILLFPVAFFAAPALAEPTGDMPVLNPTPEHALCPETPMSMARKMGKQPPSAR